MIEARCPKCRNVKDPEQPLCGPCSVTTRLQREAELQAKLDRIPGPVLVVGWLLIYAVIILWKLAGLLACGFVAYHYWTLGNQDLALVWGMLGVLSLPSVPPKSPKANA